MMPLEKSLDGMLKRYVFGALDDDARLVLEERVVTEPEVFDALGVVEDDLIEAYLEGTLPNSERRAFEQHFMACADQRQQVSFIRMLKHRALASADPVDRPAFVPWSVDGLRAHPWWVGAVAASVVALAGGNLWFAMTANRLQGELARARAGHAATESRPRPTPPEQAAVTPPPPPVTAERVEQSTRTVPSIPPTFALVAGLLRGEGTTTRVAIPGDAETIRLLLEVQAIQYTVYRVALMDAGGEELVTLSKLKADRRPRGAAVVVELPSALLARGDYQARLSGNVSPGQWNDIATYTFRVTADSRKPRFK